METDRPKIGEGDWPQLPVRYSDIYAVEQTTGPDRLVIGPSGRHVEVLLSLAQVWQRDYYVLYVLMVPRQGTREPGRYQSPGPLSFDQVATFCRKFAPFLEGDGRHHLWIGSAVSAGLLIYDHHDWLYAYGDLSEYTRVLQSQGFTEGSIRLPSPHTHGYNARFDDVEDELINYCKWRYSPLQPGDDY